MFIANQEAVRATKKAILERGQKALIEALGPKGAMDFMAESAAVERSDKEDDSIKRLMMHIDVDHKANEVVIRFNQPITWLRFSPMDALNFVGKIAERAKKLASNADA